MRFITLALLLVAPACTHDPQICADPVDEVDVEEPQSFDLVAFEVVEPVVDFDVELVSLDSVCVDEPTWPQRFYECPGFQPRE